MATESVDAVKSNPQPKGTIGTFRGKKIEDMNKPELLEVIEYLVDEMQHYKLSAEEKSARLEAEVAKTLGPPPQSSPITKWIRA